MLLQELEFFLLFNHTVDPEEATLKIEVLRPDLTFMFSHLRPKVLGPARVAESLERKTVGFVCLVKGDDRHVLS